MAKRVWGRGTCGDGGQAEVGVVGDPSAMRQHRIILSESEVGTYFLNFA